MVDFYPYGERLLNKKGLKYEGLHKIWKIAFETLFFVDLNAMPKDQNWQLENAKNVFDISSL